MDNFTSKMDRMTSGQESLRLLQRVTQEGHTLTQKSRQTTLMQQHKTPVQEEYAGEDTTLSPRNSDY